MKRSTRIIVKGYDTHGKKTEYESGGLLARVIQHEIDHLMGVLISDHTPLKRKRSGE